MGGGYRYYHLLSGNDLPIKKQSYIHNFFSKHDGEEFVELTSIENCNKEVKRRAKLYSFFLPTKKMSKLKRVLYSLLRKVLLVVQIIFRVDRSKKDNYNIFYGGNWFSITNDCVKSLLDNQCWIKKRFSRVSCCDELFLQTFIGNSAFRNRVFNLGKNASNLRFIDWEKSPNGKNPYIFKCSDYQRLLYSNCLFARKFDKTVDPIIIQKIVELVKEDRG
jgi:hypothetical protein